MAQSVSSTYTFFPRGRQVSYFTGTVARTDTSAKDLFLLKAGDIPLEINVYSPTASDAGTSARLSIGSTSNASYFVAAMDLKGSTITSGGIGQSTPSSAANLAVPLAFDTVVQATYAESGAASTTGGPWTVIFQVLEQ